MTFRAAFAGYWICNSNGCTVRVAGDLHELPEGWIAEEVEIEPGQKWTRHKCPTCVAQEKA